MMVLYWRLGWKWLIWGIERLRLILIFPLIGMGQIGYIRGLQRLSMHLWNHCILWLMNHSSYTLYSIPWYTTLRPDKEGHFLVGCFSSQIAQVTIVLSGHSFLGCLFFHLGKKIAISLSIYYFSFFIYNVSMYMANESNLFLVIFAELGDYVTILFSFLSIFHVDME